MSVKSNDVPVGNYDFVIYQWRFHGIREDLILKPIAFSKIVTDHLPRLLEAAFGSPTDISENYSSPVWEDIDKEHYRLWSEVRSKHQQRTRELAEYQKESLKTSHRARISLLEEQFKQASNEKIQKMRQSQIVSAEGDYARRVQELKIAMEKAEVTSRPVAYGVIQVEEDKVYAK